VDDSATRRRLRSGRLFRVFPGVYSVGRMPVTQLEWASATVRACGPYLHRSQLAEQLVRHPCHPGAKRLAAYVLTPDGPTRSDWERTIPAWCEQHNLPRPTLSFRSSGHEVDAYFPGADLLVESTAGSSTPRGCRSKTTPNATQTTSTSAGQRSGLRGGG
jgi:hypothetical protein